MTQPISPRLGKFAALALLLVATWAVLTVGSRIVAARLSVQGELRDLRALHDDIHARRIDITSLESGLAALASSEGARRAAIAADSERAALARLHQILRKGVEDAGGQLLALNETGARATVSSEIATQVRVRIGEAALTRLLATWQDGATALRVHEFSIAARARQAAAAPDLELTAILRAHWVPQKGRSL
jgi:hypothetical protein